MPAYDKLKTKVTHITRTEVKAHVARHTKPLRKLLQTNNIRTDRYNNATVLQLLRVIEDAVVEHITYNRAHCKTEALIEKTAREL